MKGTLKDHMEVLGHDVGNLAFLTKVPEAVIRRALAGQPITAAHASQLKRNIGREFGHPHHSTEEYPIDGLNIV